MLHAQVQVFIDPGSPALPLTGGEVLRSVKLSQGVRNCMGRNKFLETSPPAEMGLCVPPAMWLVGADAACSGPYNRRLTWE